MTCKLIFIILFLIAISVSKSVAHVAIKTPFESQFNPCELMPNGNWLLSGVVKLNKIQKTIGFAVVDSCMQIHFSAKYMLKPHESIAGWDLCTDHLSNIYVYFQVRSSQADYDYPHYIVLLKYSSDGVLDYAKKMIFDNRIFRVIPYRRKFMAIDSSENLYVYIGLMDKTAQFELDLMKISPNGKLLRYINVGRFDLWSGSQGLRGLEYGKDHLYLSYLCDNCAGTFAASMVFDQNLQLIDRYSVAQNTGSPLGSGLRQNFDEQGNLYVAAQGSNETIVFKMDDNEKVLWSVEIHGSYSFMGFVNNISWFRGIVNESGNFISELIGIDSSGQILHDYRLLGNIRISALNIDKNGEMMILYVDGRWEHLLMDTLNEKACGYYQKRYSRTIDTNNKIEIKNLSLFSPKGVQKEFEDFKVPLELGWFKYTFNCNTGLFGSSLLADTLLCYGNEVELSPEVFGDTAGIKYKWSTGATNKNLITKQSGIYKLNITNGACSHNHQTQVLMADEARALVPDSLGLCPADTGEIALNPLFKNSIYWYKPDSSIEENTSIKLKDEGPYYLNSYQAHCLEIDSVQVKTLSEKTVNAGQDSLICYGQELNLNGSGAKKYNWQPKALFTNGKDTLANPNIKPKADVKIKLQAVNLNGCAEEDSVLISVRDPLQIEIQQNDTSLCEGDSFILSAKATGGLAAQYEYVWDGSSTKSDSHSLQLSKSKNFILQLKDKCSEPAFDSIQLNVSEVEKSDIAYQPNPAMAGKIIQFSNPNPIYDSVKWMVNDTFFNQPTPNNHVFRREGQYQITQLIYQKGCADSNLLTLAVGDQLIYFYPTAFSPNGDGINDEWFIKGHSIANVELRIFNIWGERIFWFEGPQVKWDGTFRDQPAPIGDYIFMATVTASNGQKVEVQGEFAVVK